MTPSRHQHRPCLPAGAFHAALLLVLFLVASSAFGSASIGEYLSRTNSPQVEAPAAQAPGVIASGSFVRPAIASDGQALYVAAEGPGMASVHYWTGKAGKWQGGLVVTASRNTAERTYVVDVLPGIVSFRYGKKEAGKLHGPGLYRNGREEFPNLTTGAARLAMSKDGPILMSKNGAWLNLSTVHRGQYNSGSTGEKFAFVISGDTWATCMNGWSNDHSSVSINGKRQVWADYATYGKSYGNDLCYPDLCLDVNGTAYMTAVLAGRLRIQVLEAGKLRFPLTALFDAGPATMEDRCPPRIVATAKTVHAFFVLKGSIYRLDVKQALKGKAKPVLVCAGSQPDVCAGPDESLHMVYVAGRQLLYRRIE